MSTAELDRPAIASADTEEEAREVEVYLVLEGGGVRGGLIHIGALWAISRIQEESKANTNWQRLTIKGVAGTSIGSIIAALLAAGYAVEEIMDREGRLPLLDTLETSLEKIFPTGGLAHLRIANRYLSELDPEAPLREGLRYLKRRLRWATKYAAIAVVGVPFAYRTAATYWKTLQVGEPLKTTQLQELGAPIRDALKDAFDVLFNPEPWLALLAVSLLLAIFRIVTDIRRAFHGFVSTEDLANTLNLALAKKLSQSDQAKEKGLSEQNLARQGVRFTDLLDFGGKPLRVVATDTYRKDIELFSEREPKHRGTRIADAVAASVAIPIVFKPVAITNLEYTRFQDGGLISNLPAWTWDHVRTLESDAWVVSVEVTPNPDKPVWFRTMTARNRGLPRDRQPKRNIVRRRLASISGFISDARELSADHAGPTIARWFSGLGAAYLWPFKFALRTLYSGLFGARDIEARHHDRLLRMPVASQIELLDFEVSEDNRRRAIELAEEAVYLRLKATFHDHPLLFTRFCDRITKSFIDMLKPDWKRNVCEPGGVSGSHEENCIRVVVTAPMSDVDAARIVFGREYTDFGDLAKGRRSMIDDRLVLPFDTSVVGTAFCKGEYHFADEEEIDRMFKRRRDRYRDRMKVKGMKWRWATPVYLDGRSHGEPKEADYVLCIESSIPEEAWVFRGINEVKVAISAMLSEHYCQLVHELQLSIPDAIIAESEKINPNVQ